jgi:uncharacterized protein YjbI with pentapeptide repeats
MRKDNYSLFWQSNDGQKLRKEVLKNIFANKSLTNITSLKNNGDKIDLRGLKLREKDEMFFCNFKNLHLLNIDFSFADFTLSSWQNVTFENIIFEESIFDHTVFKGCNFLNCKFLKSKFNLAHFEYSSEKNRGLLENVLMEKCKINVLGFSFPIIKNLYFKDCVVKGVLDFGGSNFSNSKFEGKLDNIIFRGYPKKEDWKNWLDKLLDGHIKDVKKYPNLMENVDFLDADIKNASFKDDIDLSRCKFRDNEIPIVQNL